MLIKFFIWVNSTNRQMIIIFILIDPIYPLIRIRSKKKTDHHTRLT